jgi:hypothetical protein|tara:strand:- start:216 stop:380 length:165 start_codon:yes stop_codon:yes gene_type:complete
MYQCNKDDVTNATDESAGYKHLISEVLLCVALFATLYMMCYIGFALDVAGGYER